MSTADLGADSAASAEPVILCVDDEPNILSALRRLFRSRGYTVRVAQGGAAGLQLLENETVDIVISDMRMPGMDGAQFLQRVREHWPETVRLLLTGHSDVPSIIEAINRGEIYRYVTKPWDDHDLVLLVRDALERKGLEQERRRLEALTRSQNEALKALNRELEQRVAERTAELAAANEFLLQANERLKSNFATTLKVFSTLIEMRGGSLAGHSRRVADLARRIALKLGLEDRLVQEVFAAGLLHEIGKLGFSDALLSTPVAMMTAKQLGEYRQHVVRGEHLLMPLPDLHAAASCIGSQLERYDGQGFPARLFEHAIPIGARILALASDFDNLQIGVLAHRRMTPDEARTTLVQGKGKRYDPEILAVLLTLLDPAGEGPGGSTGSEVALAARDLVSGMRLSRDLIAPNGLLMLSAAHVLDERLIVKILDFQRASGVELTVHVQGARPPG